MQYLSAKSVLQYNYAGGQVKNISPKSRTESFEKTLFKAVDEKLMRSY
jgi:hypothetical protein